jgi:hypothetical protein
MNYDKKYFSSPWIKNADYLNSNNLDKLDNNKLYKLYATKNASLSSGREYIALPADKILTNQDISKYNIQK